MFFAKLKKSGKPEVGGLSFGGESDYEYILRDMMWTDNYWLFCHDREVLLHMVNDVIKELLDMDMDSKPESLWWTCSYEEGGRPGDRMESTFHGSLRCAGIPFSS